MKIIKIEKIEVDSDAKVYTLANQAGDTIVKEIYIQTPSNVGVAVTGAMVDQEEIALKLVDMANLTVVESGESAGVYCVESAPYESIKMTFTGSGDVTVKMVK